MSGSAEAFPILIRVTDHPKESERVACEVRAGTCARGPCTGKRSW